MRRRLVLRRGSFPVEQQHHARSKSVREAPSSQAERLEAEHVLVETLHVVLLIGCVVQNGLEHAGEPEIFGHDANVLVLTRRRQRTWSGLQTRVVVRLFCDTNPAPVLPEGATEWVFATSANVDTVIALIAAQTGGGLLPRLALAPIVAVSSGRWESVR